MKILHIREIDTKIHLLIELEDIINIDINDSVVIIQCKNIIIEKSRC